MFGSFTWGKICDLYGRKIVIKLSYVITCNLNLIYLFQGPYYVHIFHILLWLLVRIGAYIRMANVSPWFGWLWHWRCRPSVHALLGIFAQITQGKSLAGVELFLANRSLL